MPTLEHVTLITGRTLEQGAALEAHRTSEECLRACAQVELDPDDMKKLGVAAKKHVKVTTKAGAVVLAAVKAEKAHPGIAIVPVGPWANFLIDEGTTAGIPVYKGIPATIEAPCSEQIIPVGEIFA